MVRKPTAAADQFGVPRWLWTAAADHRLTPAEITVFCAMCSLRGESGVISASLRLIAEQSTISRAAVAAALPELTRRGFLIDLGIPASRRPRMYRVAELPPLPPIAMESPSRRAVNSGGGWIVAL